MKANSLVDGAFWPTRPMSEQLGVDSFGPKLKKQSE